MLCLVARLCHTLCDPVECSLLSMGILEARILELVAMPSFRRSSRRRDQTQEFSLLVFKLITDRKPLTVAILFFFPHDLELFFVGGGVIYSFITLLFICVYIVICFNSLLISFHIYSKKCFLFGYHGEYM